DEFVGLIREGAIEEAQELQTQSAEPSSVGKLYFRLLVAQYARKDTAADLSGGWLGRWRLLRAVWTFARGRGNIPALQPVFQRIPFSALETSFGGLAADQEEILSRYFRVKVQGL